MYSFLCINHTFVMFLFFFKEPFLKSRCLESNKVCFTEWTNGLAGGLERGCLKLHPLTRVRTYQPKAAWHQQGALALFLDAGDLSPSCFSPPLYTCCHGTTEIGFRENYNPVYLSLLILETCMKQT